MTAVILVLQLLLNYLPLERKNWEQVLNDKRAAYRVFCKVGRFLPGSS